ncbi:MAG: DUF4411 family protein [Terracidiphilus sp.]
MLYLLDANVLITASSTYYPLDQIPEFWGWIHYQATSDRIKIPCEILEEVKAGRKDDDPLLDWICTPEIETALLLDEAVDELLVQRVVSTGYAVDLRDDEIEKIGRDPFLMAYALADPINRTVVTTEVSRPSTKRAIERFPMFARP